MSNRTPKAEEKLDHERVIDQLIELRLENQSLIALVNSYSKELERWLTKQERAERIRK